MANNDRYSFEELTTLILEDTPPVLNPVVANQITQAAVPLAPVVVQAPAQAVVLVPPITSTWRRCFRCDIMVPLLVSVNISRDYDCNHKYCKRCIHKYITENISDRIGNMPCPDRDCNYILGTRDVFRITNSIHTARAYKSLTPIEPVNAVIGSGVYGYFSNPRINPPSLVRIHPCGPNLEDFAPMTNWFSQRTYTLFGGALSEDSFMQIDGVMSNEDTMMIMFSFCSPRLKNRIMHEYIDMVSSMLALPPSEFLSVDQKTVKEYRAMFLVSIHAPNDHLLSNRSLHLSMITQVLISILAKNLEKTKMFLDIQDWNPIVKRHIFLIKSEESLSKLL